MKKYFYFFAIFLFGINWTVNIEAQQAKKDDFSKWILVEKEEVQFRIPQNWRYQQDPEKGVLLKIEPNNDPEKAFMLVVQRAPTPTMKLTSEEEKNLFQQFAVMGRRMIEHYGVNAIIKHTIVIQIMIQINRINRCILVHCSGCKKFERIDRYIIR